MTTELTGLEEAVLNVVRTRSGLPASAVARQLGRDRNQIRRLLLGLADRGHVIPEEKIGQGGVKIVFYAPDSPRSSSPYLAADQSNTEPQPSPLRVPLVRGPLRPMPPQERKQKVCNTPVSPYAPPVEPIEGRFKVVSEPRTPARLPVPYGGQVIHQSPAHKETRGQAKLRVDPMVQAIMLLSDADPDGSATLAMFQRQRIEKVEAAERARQIEVSRREAVHPAAKATPTLAEVMAEFATAMKVRAKQAGKTRVRNEPEPIAGEINVSSDIGDEPSAREVRSVRKHEQMPSNKPPYPMAVAAIKSRPPPWRRPPPQPRERSWLERVFGVAAPDRKPVWK